jgi:flagellar basal-body rod protein FlgB
MPISEIPLFSMLRTRMQWHQERQRVLAENVANADTPKFRPHDLAPLQLNQQTVARTASITLARTDNSHITSSAGDSAAFQADRSGYEVRPAGNAVTLEDEMMKVAANQMDYQAATTLYIRSLNLLKTALGKR